MTRVNIKYALNRTSKSYAYEHELDVDDDVSGAIALNVRYGLNEFEVIDTFATCELENPNTGARLTIDSDVKTIQRLLNNKSTLSPYDDGALRVLSRS